MDFITAYKQAFLSCYPQKTIDVKPRRVRGALMYRVIIDSDPGDTMLSEEDMRGATRMFMRGRV